MSRDARGSLRSSYLADRLRGLDDLGGDLEGLSALGNDPLASGPCIGMRALMLAVLDNAITSYLSRTPRIRAEAEYWISTAQQQSPFSFTVVCETLGLEPSAVRAALVRLRERSVAPRAVLGRRRPNVRRNGRVLAPKAS